MRGRLGEEVKKLSHSNRANREDQRKGGVR